MIWYRCRDLIVSVSSCSVGKGATDMTMVVMGVTMVAMDSATVAMMQAQDKSEAIPQAKVQE